MKHLLPILVVLTLAFSLPSSALADGVIIPQPPICDPCPPPPCPFPMPCPPPSPTIQLAIRYHHVTVTIKDQLAITHVDQVFFNPNAWEVEGLYIFPIPKDAAISSFSLWIDGEPVNGQILEAEQARQQYWDIVKSLQDPALLEYLDRSSMQAHIFPIPPQGERRIELEYVQTISTEDGLARYIYPLNTEKFSLWPLEQVLVHLDISNSQPIQAVYSPSHAIQVTRLSANHVQVNYEANQVIPDKDFALYYSPGSGQLLHLLTYRDPNDLDDPDGFFLLLLAPDPEPAPEKMPKDVILVLDRSGSMEGEKFHQAQDALRYILEKLNPQDRFNLIAFSTTTQTFSSELRSIQAVPEAMDWVDGLSAQGSTDINRALLEAAAMSNNERPAYLIFLTDGLPTEGVIESGQILDNLANAAPENLRLFSFGVGYDVDTYLLDSLTSAHHGATTYVLPGERLDEILSGFYAKIDSPVLTDLQLDFGELNVYDVYPNHLPDLFEGTQIIVSGRYRHGGSADLTLRANAGDQVQEFQFTDLHFNQEKPDDPALAALGQIWATRKIGHMLNQIRLQGPDQETIQQIIQISIRYGIVTPYTSYLVTEGNPLGAVAQERMAQEEFERVQSAPAAPVFGQAAVEKSAFQGAMAEAETQLSVEPAVQQMIRSTGSRSFIFQDGTWIDTAFDPENMQTKPIDFLSQEYMEMANSDADMAAVFALGKSVIIVQKGKAYEVKSSEDISAAPFEVLTATPVEGSLLLSTDTPHEPAQNETPGTPSPAPVSLPGCSSAFILIGFIGLWVLVFRKQQ